MTTPQRGTAHSLEPIALKLLRKLMKPVKVRGLVFTSCGRRTVRGIIMTRSPTERREVARNFEVGEFRGCSVGFVSVDGKRVFSRRGERMKKGKIAYETAGLGMK